MRLSSRSASVALVALSLSLALACFGAAVSAQATESTPVVMSSTGGYGWNGSCPDATATTPTPAAPREETLADQVGDAFSAWIGFFFVTIASSQVSLLVRYINLPLITGYMFFGTLVGPQVLHMVSKDDISYLQPITQFALAFISLSAGAELYLPELKALFRRILTITGLVTVICFILSTFLVWGLAAGGLVPFMSPLSGSCQFSISLIAASIMVTQSPSSTIAVVAEVKAKGPFTSTMLGITVLTDIIVLLIFSVCSSVANANCSAGADGFHILDLITALACILVAGILGYLFGKVIIFLIWKPQLHGEWLVMPLGFGIFRFCTWFTEYSTEQWGHGINFDALLICIFAGYVVANQSRNRRRFLRFLSSIGPIVFIPFFTLTGATLNLKAILQAAAFAFIVFAVRAVTFLVGSVVGGRYTGMSKKHQQTLWIAMLTQAGVSIGICAEVAIHFPSWGPDFQSTIVAVILINQIIGPVACKWALKTNGEVGMGSGDHDEEEEGHIKRCVIVGINISSLAVAQRLIKHDWNVLFLDTDARKTDMLTWITYERRAKREKTKELLEQRARRAKMRAEAIAKSEFVDLDPPSKNSDLPASPSAAAAAAEDVPAGSSSPSSSHAEASSSGYAPVDQSPETAGAASSSGAAASSDSLQLPGDFAVESAMNTTTPPDEQQLQFRLLSTDGVVVHEKDPLAKLSYAREAVALRHALADCNASNVDAAIVMLESDALNFDLCSVLLDKLQLTRVVAEVQNPNWTSSFASLGVLPVFPYSLASHTLFQLVVSPPGHAPHLIDPSRPLHVSLAHVIQPDTASRPSHAPLYLRHLGAEDREAFHAAHPDPPLPKDQLWKLNEKVNVVSAAARDEYLKQIGSLQSNLQWDLSQRLAASAAESTFSGPAMLNSTGGADDGEPMDEEERKLREARRAAKQKLKEERKKQNALVRLAHSPPEDEI